MLTKERKEKVVDALQKQYKLRVIQEKKKV